ncbi:type VI secretion system-associated protein TagF [Arsukibacterium sp.]|uniref:type VI secretion system-associated protein TagF n=1 Tax=Arsukibacterium sp. TaxID=1977258 RepID=UPI00299CF9FF|nr:type VI secretion system-associated protein TagF [Arsukibacterium sp.]MDX1538032.1 type VI secretion system-associated protein TagF [Arsukibacterium sp.]
MSGQPVAPGPLAKVGFCGKVVSQGDFLAQGLDVAFVDSWNEWLQAVLAVSREQLGQGWLETYLTSPIWHFALCGGVCGDQAMAGTLMPSVDQVGRHYPFTLAAELAVTPVQAWQEQDWCAPLEQQALATLDEDFALQPWLTKLADMPIAWPKAPRLSVSQSSNEAIRQAWTISASEPLDSIALLHQSYLQQFSRYCLWWTSGSEQVAPCLLVTSGLPQVSQYAAMLDGDWTRWNWQQKHIQY